MVQFSELKALNCGKCNRGDTSATPGRGWGWRSSSRASIQILTGFKLTAGPVDLRFFVRETTTGRAGSLRTRLTVPAFDSRHVVVCPPLVMDDPRTRIVLPAPSRAKPDLQIPFRLEDVPFTPETWPLGELVPRIVSDADGFQRLVFSVSPRGVESGEYVLRVRIPDTGHEAPAESEVPVRIPGSGRFSRPDVARGPKTARPG